MSTETTAARPVISSSPRSQPDATTLVVRIARDDRRPLRREPFDQREERAVVVEAVGLGGHAVADRMRRVDFDLEDRAGREVLIARQPALQVADRHGEVLDRERRGRAERHQRAAGRDELLERVDSLGADPAAVLRAGCSRPCCRRRSARAPGPAG